MRRAIVQLVQFYRAVAPRAVRSACRFQPTCSEYLLLAVEKHGVKAGVRMSARRLRRCQPTNGGTDFP